MSCDARPDPLFGPLLRRSHIPFIRSVLWIGAYLVDGRDTRGSRSASDSLESLASFSFKQEIPNSRGALPSGSLPRWRRPQSSESDDPSNSRPTEQQSHGLGRGPARTLMLVRAKSASQQALCPTTRALGVAEKSADETQGIERSHRV
jgi:hypothetical protein